MTNFNSVLVEGRFSDMGETYGGGKIRMFRVVGKRGMIVLPVRVDAVEKEGLEEFPSEERVRIVGRVENFEFGMYVQAEHWERIGGEER